MTDPLLDIADPDTCAALKLNGRVEYANPAEAVSVARELLGNYGQRFMIGAVTEAKPQLTLGEHAAALMTEHCMPHTWDARAQVIVDWYEKMYGKDKNVPELLSVHDWGIPKEQLIGGVTAQEAVENVTKLSQEVNKPIGEITEDGNLKVTDLPMMPDKRPKAYLNLGCGTTHFPSERPPGHELIDASVYQYPLWLNVDKVEGVGADCVFDLFAYPWPLEDNSFDGAVLGHIVEHVPHEIKILNDINLYDADDMMLPKVALTAEQHALRGKLRQLQDGFYAFFSELYRVLTPGAIAHIISPFAWSDGAIIDPTHTRMLTVQSFLHGLSPDQYSGTFKYNIACNFEVVGHVLRYTENAKPFTHDMDLLQNAIMTRVNMCYDFMVQLRAIK